MKGSYSQRWVRGSEWACSCGHKWGYANVSISQARAEGLDCCKKCGKKGRGKSIKTLL